MPNYVRMLTIFGNAQVSKNPTAHTILRSFALPEG